MKKFSTLKILDIITLVVGILGIICSIVLTIAGDSIENYIGAILVSLLMIASGILGLIAKNKK